MTRETKVGLVVGTGIILLIGIVVSDHLASQQRGQQQTSAPPGYTDLSNGQPRTINPQGVRPLVDAATKDRENRGITTIPPATPEDRNANARRDYPPIIRYGPDGRILPPDAPDSSGNSGTGNNAGASTPGPSVADRNLPDPGLDRNLPDRGGASTLPPSFARDLRNNDLLPEDPTPRKPTTEPLIHHVQPGESLWAIAEKYYGVGNGRYSTEIARANHEMLMADGGVRVGVRLVIPNRTITTPGSSVNGTADRNSPGVTPPTSNDGPPTPPTGNHFVPRLPPLKTVKVEPGDSLSAIATRSLGSIKHMQLIIDANKNLIHDADDIKAGMTLVIPDLPATAVVPPAPAPRTPGTVTPPTTPPVTPPAVATNAKVHKVQPRDTFTSIARTRLGSERRWKEIYDLNKKQVADPDALREGIVLVLPADAR